MIQYDLRYVAHDNIRSPYNSIGLDTKLQYCDNRDIKWQSSTDTSQCLSNWRIQNTPKKRRNCGFIHCIVKFTKFDTERKQWVPSSQWMKVKVGAHSCVIVIFINILCILCYSKLRVVQPVSIWLWLNVKRAFIYDTDHCKNQIRYECGVRKHEKLSTPLMRRKNA